MINLTAFRCYLLVLLLALVLGGCGGGGGASSSGTATADSGGGGSSSGISTTRAKTSLKTSGLASSGLLVGALEVVISMPYGVTVELDPATNEPARSVVTLVGTADPKMTMSALHYVAATPTTKGSLRIVYINAAGFTPSDSLSIGLDIATGFFPKATDFALTKFEITTMSADGSTINAPAAVQNPVFTAEII